MLAENPHCFLKIQSTLGGTGKNDVQLRTSSFSK